jgi:sphingosine kinase
MEGHAANVRVDGAPAEATLGGGELRWRRAGTERALSLEDEVLGVEARGEEVVVRAFVVPAAAAKSRSCVGVAGAGGAVTKRCRKEFVFEMADVGEGASAAWAEKLRAYLDSFGTCAALIPLVLGVSLLRRSPRNATKSSMLVSAMIGV